MFLSLATRDVSYLFLPSTSNSNSYARLMAWNSLVVSITSSPPSPLIPPPEEDDAIRRLASGWYFFASLRYADFISAGVAVRDTPRMA